MCISCFEAPSQSNSNPNVLATIEKQRAAKRCLNIQSPATVLPMPFKPLAKPRWDPFPLILRIVFRKPSLKSGQHLKQPLEGVPVYTQTNS